MYKPHSIYPRAKHPIQFNRNSVMALGCSCTYGFGLDEHEAWPWLLEEKMGMPVYNFGVNGGSADSVFRVLATHLPIIQSRVLCIQAPSDYRREIWYEGNDEPDRIGAWVKERIDLLGEKEVALNKKKNYYAIIDLARRYDCEIRFFRSNDSNENRRDLEAPYASDGLHPGTRWHEYVANHMLSVSSDLNRIYDYVD